MVARDTTVLTNYIALIVIFLTIYLINGANTRANHDTEFATPRMFFGEPVKDARNLSIHGNQLRISAKWFVNYSIIDGKTSNKSRFD